MKLLQCFQFHSVASFVDHPVYDPMVSLVYPTDLVVCEVPKNHFFGSDYSS